jgi:hypothetical protein
MSKQTCEGAQARQALQAALRPGIRSLTCEEEDEQLSTMLRPVGHPAECATESEVGSRASELIQNGRWELRSGDLATQQQRQASRTRDCAARSRAHLGSRSRWGSCSQSKQQGSAPRSVVRGYPRIQLKNSYPDLVTDIREKRRVAEIREIGARQPSCSGLRPYS